MPRQSTKHAGWFMLNRAEAIAVGVGSVLLIAGIASYSWRAGLIAAGVLLIVAAITSRRETM